MKITHLKIGGIGRFDGDVDVPIEQLGESRLVALVGNNGEGKTTLAECVPAGLYRSMPSRGPVAGMAVRKDSFIDLGVELDGAMYQAKQIVDGMVKRPKSEAYLINGGPVNDGKAKTFDAAVSERFPSEQVYLSSAFAAQTRKGQFLDLPKAERKTLFAEMLGLGRLQSLSDLAGERSRNTEAHCNELRAKLELLSTMADGLPELREQRDAAKDLLRVSRETRESAEAEAGKLREVRDEWAAEFRRLENERIRIRGEYNEAIAALRSAEREHDGHIERALELKNRGDQLDANISAIEFDPDLILQGKSAELDIPQAELDLQSAREMISGHRADVAQWEKDRAELTMNLQRARDKHQVAIQQARQDYKAALDELRIAEKSAASLGDVPCGGEGEFSVCPLISSATEAAGKIGSLRERVEQLTITGKAVAEVPEEITAYQAALGRFREKPQKPDESEVVEKSAALVALRETARQGSEHREKRERLSGLEAQMGTVREDQAVAESKRDTARNEVRRLGVALATVADSMGKSSTAVDAHNEREPAALDESGIASMRDTETRAEVKLAKLDQSIADAEAASEDGAVREKELDKATADLDDWRHLQKALGRDGIQALEIDAAGPGVSELCNDLLHACYGTRFSVSLETAAIKADGKGTKEVFDLCVIDTERGTEGSADQLSGGEKVLVSEALALAIAIHNAQRSGVSMADLWRDECAGALSSENATRYIEMLRRALDLGGFHRCYFVAHQPHLWDLADAQLRVAGGRVELR